MLIPGNVTRRLAVVYAGNSRQIPQINKLAGIDKV
jgi:hypothetical protein